MYTKEQMMLNCVIHDVLKHSSIDEVLAVWTTVKSVCSKSLIKEALSRTDEEYDGTVNEVVSQWIPNNEQDVVKAEQNLEHARRRLEEARKRAEDARITASEDKKVWKELRKKL